MESGKWPNIHFISSIDLEVRSFIDGSRSSYPKSGYSSTFGEEEFHFLEKRFDVLSFIYYHLNATRDIKKSKSLGSHKILQLIGIYLMRSVVLCQTVFEVSDSLVKSKGGLKAELKRMKGGYELNQTLLASSNERIVFIENYLTNAKTSIEKDEPKKDKLLEKKVFEVSC